MTYCVSCDWLSLSCQAPSDYKSPTAGTSYEVPRLALKFTYAPAIEFNPYYSFACRFQYQGQDAFHFFATPRHPDADPRDCSVKVANRLLYCSQWVDLLEAFLSAARLKVNHMQRFDLCADFNTFAGGRKPPQFIRDYFTAPRVSRPSFIRRGSNKFRTYGQKKLGLLDFQTLSFGTRDSPVQVNLYNKSEELRQKMKPYIKEMWEAHGLDVENVWRVEFSLNPQGMMLHHLRHDFITEVTYDQAGVYTRLLSLFTTFAERYFKFYYVTKEDEKARRKVKDLKQVVLFDYDCAAEFKPTSLCRRKNVGQREHRAALALDRLIDEKSYHTLQEREAIQTAAALFRASCQMKQTSKTRVEDEILREFAEGIATLPPIYSDKAKRERVNRWLQALGHKYYSPRYDEFCKMFNYLDTQVDTYLDAMGEILATADQDMLGL